MRTIEITVGLAGEIKIDAVGFRGPDCEQATRFLEQALGRVCARRRKPEYHARTRSVTKQGVGR